MQTKFIIVASAVVLMCINLSCNLVGASNSNQAMSKEDSLMRVANAPIMKFEEETFDFGTMTEGEVVEHQFKFTNVGKSPLQVATVQVQCGCTVASKPENPIEAGKSDVIVIRFNSEGKAGINKKFVTVYSNAVPEQSVLSFSAIVNKKDEKSAKKQNPNS